MLSKEWGSAERDIVEPEGGVGSKLAEEEAEVDPWEKFIKAVQECQEIEVNLEELVEEEVATG